METIECPHMREDKKPGPGDSTIHACRQCRQEVRRYASRFQTTPVVTKLGRIAGRVVIPNPDYKLQLDAKDTDDLGEALSACGPGSREVRAIPSRQEDQVARYKWYKKNKRDSSMPVGTRMAYIELEIAARKLIAACLSEQLTTMISEKKL